MVSELGELIARYEAAQKRVMEVVESGPDSDAELLRVDAELSSAFNDILSKDLDTPEESVVRVRFLLEQIKSNQTGNHLIERLADQVWQDIVESELPAAISSGDLQDKVAGQN